MRTIWTFVPLFFVSVGLMANPSGLDVVAGVASLERSANELRVTVGERASLNWQEFSIGANEVTRFIQPSEQSFVLNRVVGGSASTIDGLLEANGRLLLLNPAGILIGPTGVIHTAGFIASTLDVLNFDPEAPDGMRFCGSTGASVINHGQIHAPNGEVVLLGEMVSNDGVICADGVRLGTGREIVLMPAGEQRLIIQPSIEARRAEGVALDQQGRIEAIQAELRADPNPYALAINHGGYVDALCVAEVQGRIRLVADGGRIESTGSLIARNETGVGGTVHLIADQIVLGGKVDVSGAQGGGTILIGGDYGAANPEIPTATYLVVEKGAAVHADALDQGDGGRAILWGKEVCGCFGEVSAEGGPNGGNGGLIEVSGHGQFSIGGARLTTLAPMGRHGTLSFDPVNVTISTNPDSGISTDPPPAYVFNGAAGSWNINTTSLETFLASNNVVISTSSISGTDPGLAGNIDVNDSFTWSADTLLTMRADNIMTIGNGVTVHNTSATAGVDLVMDLYAATLNVGAATNTNPSTIQANNKSIQITSGSVNVTKSTAQASIKTTNNGNISIQTSGPLTIQGGVITSASMLSMLIGGDLTITGGSTGFAEASGILGLSIVLTSGELKVMGGSSSTGLGAEIAVIGAGNLNISLPSGNHGCFGGTPGFAAIEGGINVNITATGPNCNFSIIGGQAITGVSAEAQVVAGLGDISMALSSLTLGSQSPLSGSYSEVGNSSGSIQAEGNINISLTDSLVMAPIVAEGESTRIQSSHGSITITGTQFDVTIGSAFTNIGNLIQTQNGGAIIFGSPSAPAGNISILSTPFQPGSVMGTLFPLTGLRTDLGGNISVVAVGDLSITAGANPTNEAGDAGIFAAYDQGLGDIAVAARNISIQGGSNSGTGSATAGIATGLATGSTGSGAIQVLGIGDLTIQGSTVALGSNQGQIAALNGGDISVASTSSTSLLGGIGVARVYSKTGDIGLVADSIQMNQATAVVQTDAGNLNLRSHLDVTLSTGASLLINSAGSLTALAGRNFTFANNSFAQVNGGGSMTLVCDNNFPVSPMIGPGEFNLSPNALLNAPGGKVLIYTARLDQNAINNGQVINGSLFTAGPLFVNSDTEQWLIYYPGGTPPVGSFKIFYKNGPTASAAFGQKAASVIGEFFDQLNWFVNSVEDPRFPCRRPIALVDCSPSHSVCIW